MKRTKYTLEFLFRASPAILYEFLTSPTCLVRWFADEVDVNREVYEFKWNGYPEYAELIEDIEEEVVKFHWLDSDEEGEFLEFRITESPVTSETILEVTGFCDEDEIDDQKILWNTQVKRLVKECGG